MVSIYVLINPLNNTIFYIGATRHPEKRLTQHIWEAYNVKSRKAIIISEILKIGQKPILKEIKKCSAEYASINEDFYINFFKICGHPINQKPISTYSKTVISRTSSILNRGRWQLSNYVN